MMDRPTRCIDPVVKYCQGCPFGYVNYPEDTLPTDTDVTFESGCSYGLEDTEPTEEELKEFDEYMQSVIQQEEERKWQA